MTLAASGTDMNGHQREGTQAARVLIGLQIVLALAVLVAVAFYLSDAGRYLVTSPAPPVRVWLLLACAAAASVFAARSADWLRNTILLGLLAALWLSCRAMPLGDGHLWRRLAMAGEVSWSELGSTTLYAAAARWLGPGALAWLSPAAGVLSTWCWLHVHAQLRRASGTALTATTMFLETMTWLSSGLLVVFLFGFVEQTQWSVPPLLLACGHFWHYSNAAAATDLRERDPRRHLLLAVAWLTLAGAMHAQHLGLLLGVPMLIALRRRGAWRALGIDLSLALAGVAAVLGAVLLAVRGLGFSIVAGHVHGGADGRLLLSLTELFAPAHCSLIGLVLAFAAPVAVLVALATIHRPLTAARSSGDAGLLLLSLGYLAFVVLMGFDLGWPQDVDLMVTMSPPLLLWSARQLTANAATAGAGRRALLSLGLLLLGSATWCICGPLLRAREATFEQDNGPNATLRIDGSKAERGALRRRSSTPGEVVQVEVIGPPGSSWLAYEGPAHPGYSGFAYSGLIDLQLADAVLQTPRVGAGILDREGRAHFAYTLKAAPNGALLAIQAVVAQAASGPVKERFSAAAFFLQN